MAKFAAHEKKIHGLNLAELGWGKLLTLRAGPGWVRKRAGPGAHLADAVNATTKQRRQGIEAGAPPSPARSRGKAMAPLAWRGRAGAVVAGEGSDGTSVRQGARWTAAPRLIGAPVLLQTAATGGAPPVHFKKERERDFSERMEHKRKEERRGKARTMATRPGA